MTSTPHLERLKNLADALNADNRATGALAFADFTVQFRILGAVRNQPLSTFAGTTGDWLCLRVQAGKAIVEAGDVRTSTPWPRRVEIEIEEVAFVELTEGRATGGELVLQDRLIAGGALAHWALTLIHVGQLARRHEALAPGGRLKNFFRAARPQVG